MRFRLATFFLGAVVFSTQKSLEWIFAGGKNQLLGPKINSGDLGSSENCLWPSSLEDPGNPKNPLHLQECERIRDGKNPKWSFLKENHPFSPNRFTCGVLS